MAETEELRNLANARLDGVNEEYLGNIYEILCTYNNAASQQSQFPAHLTPKYLRLLRAVLTDALKNTNDEVSYSDMAEAVQLLSVFNVMGLRDSSNINFTQVLNEFVDTVFYYNKNKYYTTNEIAGIADLNGPTSNVWDAIQFLVVVGRHLDACNLISTLLVNVGTVDALKVETSRSYTSQIIGDVQFNFKRDLNSYNLRELLSLRLGEDLALPELAPQNRPASHFHLRYLLNLLTQYPVDQGIADFNAWRAGVLAWERVLLVETEMARLQIEEGVRFEKRVVHDEDHTLFQQRPEAIITYMNELYKAQRKILTASGHEMPSLNVWNDSKTAFQSVKTNTGTSNSSQREVGDDKSDNNNANVSSENDRALDNFRRLLDICQIMLGKNTQPNNGLFKYTWWTHMTMLYFYTEPRESAISSHFTESLHCYPASSTSLATWELGAQALFEGSFVSALNCMHQVDLPQATVLSQMLDYGGKLELYGEPAQFVVDELSVEFATLCTSTDSLLNSGLDILVGMSRSSLAREWAATLLPLLLQKDVTNVLKLASCAKNMGITPLDNQLLFAGAKLYRKKGDYASAVKVYDLSTSYAYIYELVWELFQNHLTEQDVYEVDIKTTALAQFINDISKHSSTSSSHVVKAQLLAARICDIIVSVQVRDTENVTECMHALMQFPEPPSSVPPLLVAFICGQTDLVINRDLADILLTMLGRDQQVAEQVSAQLADTPSSERVLRQGLKQQRGGNTSDEDMSLCMLITALKRELLKRIELI